MRTRKTKQEQRKQTREETQLNTWLWSNQEEPTKTRRKRAQENERQARTRRATRHEDPNHHPRRKTEPLRERDLKRLPF